MPQTRLHPNSISAVAKAFTLTELIVVLAVLAILAAVLFPVIASSRRKAQEATCLQNLRQISQALTMYVGDNDGTYPMGVEGIVLNHTVQGHNRVWGDLLLPYLRAHVLSACPNRDLSNSAEDFKQRSSACGYIINARLSRRNGTRERSIQQGRAETILAYPSLTVTLYEARVGMVEGASPDTALNVDSLNAFFHHALDPEMADYFLSQPPGATRHHGGAHYAFADGHVKWHQPSDLSISKRSDGMHPGFGL